MVALERLVILLVVLLAIGRSAAQETHTNAGINTQETLSSRDLRKYCCCNIVGS